MHPWLARVLLFLTRKTICLMAMPEFLGVRAEMATLCLFGLLSFGYLLDFFAHINQQFVGFQPVLISDNAITTIHFSLCPTINKL